MVFCAAFDCNNDSRYTTGISYHCFPRDEALRSQWLAKISRADLVVSKNSRLCSEHFTPDCYERDLKAEILGLKPRSTLKPGAIPKVFSHRRPSKRPRLSSEKRSEEKSGKNCRIEEHAASALEQPTPVDVVNCGASTSTSDSPSYPFPHYLGPKSTLVESQAVQVNLPNKGVDFGIQVNRGLHLMMKSTDTQVEVDVSESSTQTEEVFLPEIEDNKEEATEAAASPEVSPRKDDICLPTKQEDSDD
ncbi:peroxynitrite isomerase THAP4-like [Pocillopora verrucosa]|uniref:peroxynitrite isomerase THAP4-like n=1 Tax=Pocillopora verrucosa TaxID=203993 RepID=UPI00333F5E63